MVRRNNDDDDIDVYAARRRAGVHRPISNRPRPAKHVALYSATGREVAIAFSMAAALAGITTAATLYGNAELTKSDHSATPQIASTTDISPQQQAGDLSDGTTDTKTDTSISQPTSVIPPGYRYVVPDGGLTAKERKAKPFVEKIINNLSLMEDIKDVTETNGTDHFELIQSIAFESSGDPKNFTPYAGHSARTPVQIMPLQFARLLSTYGSTYPALMQAHAVKIAAARPDRAKEYNDFAVELKFVSQFVETIKNDSGVVVGAKINEAAYNATMKPFCKGKKYPTLRARIDNLFNYYPVSMGMQDYSTKMDSQNVLRKIAQTTTIHIKKGREIVEVKDLAAKAQIAAETIGWHNLTHANNFYGADKLWKVAHLILSGRGDKPMIGNVFTQEEALRNRSAYLQTVVVKKPVAKKDRKKGAKKVVVETKTIVVSKTVAEDFHDKVDQFDMYDAIRSNMYNVRRIKVSTSYTPRPRG